jgi:hypothetical protein
MRRTIDEAGWLSVRYGMVRWMVATALVTAPVLVLTGCSSEDEAATETADATEASDTSEDAEAADSEGASDSDEFCMAVEELEDTLLLIDADSVEEVEALFADVQAAYAEVEEAAGGEYDEELEAFDQALADFEAVLSADGADIRGVIDASAELALAGEVLAEQVDCVTA